MVLRRRPSSPSRTPANVETTDSNDPDIGVDRSHRYSRNSDDEGSDRMNHTATSEGPTLSRRIKSCEACRKTKIKCVFEPPESSKCVRCLRRGLQCQLNKNLQSILDDHMSWKDELEGNFRTQQQQISGMQSLLQQVLNKLEESTNSSSRRRRRRSSSCDYQTDDSINSLPSSWAKRQRQTSTNIQEEQSDANGPGPSLAHSSHPDRHEEADPIEDQHSHGLDQHDAARGGGEAPNLSYRHHSHSRSSALAHVAQNQAFTNHPLEIQQHGPFTPLRTHGDRSRRSQATEPLQRPVNTSYSKGARLSAAHGFVESSYSSASRQDAPPRGRLQDLRAPLDRSGNAERSRSTPTSTSASASGVGNSDSILPLRALNQRETDILSRGLLPMQDAHRLLSLYLDQIDKHLFHIIRTSYYDDPARCPSATLTPATVDAWLDDIRSSSSLLLLSILAVAALHVPTTSASSVHPFPLVYKEFVKLAAMQSFSRQQTLDDIRALVIGAFYLSDINNILSGTAVRIATERGLHQSYKSTPPPRSPPSQHSAAGASNGGTNGAVNDAAAIAAAQAYEEARVYYLIYIADHHASIPHGRPPMTRQHSVVRQSYQWLSRCCGAHGIRIDDQRLVSQVKLWETLHDVIDEMGSDVHQPLDAQSLILESKFSTQLKRWLDESLLRISWCVSTETSNSVSTSEIYLNELRVSYSFAYLFLESSAFRAPQGQPPDFFAPPSTPSLRRDHETCLAKKQMAERAMQTAKTVLEGLRYNSGPTDLSSTGMYSADSSSEIFLQGTNLRFAPSHTYSMIISAIVFLVRVHESLANQSKSSHGLDQVQLEGCSLAQTFEIVRNGLEQLAAISEKNFDQHIVKKIVDGTRTLISHLLAQTKDKLRETMSRQQQPHHPHHHSRQSHQGPENLTSAILDPSRNPNATRAGLASGSPSHDVAVPRMYPPQQTAPSSSRHRGQTQPQAVQGRTDHASTPHTSQTSMPPSFSPFSMPSWAVTPTELTELSPHQGPDTAASNTNGTVPSTSNKPSDSLLLPVQPHFTIDEFDLLSNLRPVSGLDFWPDILPAINNTSHLAPQASIRQTTDHGDVLQDPALDTLLAQQL